MIIENNNDRQTSITKEKDCPCTRDCPRHGKCKECIEQHKTKKYLPACKRKKRSN